MSDLQETASCQTVQPGAEWHLKVERTARWIRIKLAGETVADSKQVIVVTETGRLPVYYIPLSDVRTDLLEPSQHTSSCSHKGTASYWHIRVGDRLSENAAWGYPHAEGQSAAIAGYLSFYWNKVDEWYEEEQQVFVHARDPYTRVDALSSSRHIQVVVGGEVVADSRRPVILFETGLTPRYYLPLEDVRREVLEPSATRTRCPYKGIASYWSVNVGGTVFKDVVWSYQEPVAEVRKIAGLVSFYNEQVDAIYVDGVKWALREQDRLPYAKIKSH